MENTRTYPVSFEFFPPKTPDGVKNLSVAALQLSECRPNFFSVTFGAGGSTRDGTIETVTRLQGETGIEVAPHLSCIGSDKQDIINILNVYQALGVRRIVALRGDLPSGMGQSGGLKHASDLIELIRATSSDCFHIEVAAYPEMHPQAAGMTEDLLNLKRKFEAGADSAITQYFYNPDAYFYFLDDCEKFGIYAPIVPGIMPITQFSKLVRFSDACGAEIPRWIRKRLMSYADDIESIKEFGIEVVYKLCETLLKGGAPGLHFYTLNQADASLRIVKELDLQLRRLPAVRHGSFAPTDRGN